MQLSQPLFELLFLISLFSGLFGVGFIFIAGSALAIFMPKKLLKTYFKEPHFSQLEIGYMSGVPGAYFRMLVFAWTVVRPTKSHVKRNITDCQKIMPKWYLYSLKIFIYIGSISFSISLGLLSFLLISASLYSLDYSKS